MCCGRRKSGSRRGKSGKIKKSQILPQHKTSDEPIHSEDRERLQPPSDGGPSIKTRVVATPEVPRQELFP